MSRSTTCKQRILNHQKQKLPCPQYSAGMLQFALFSTEVKKQTILTLLLHLHGITLHQGVLACFDKVMTQVGPFEGIAFCLLLVKGVVWPFCSPLWTLKRRQFVAKQRRINPLLFIKTTMHNPSVYWLNRAENYSSFMCQTCQNQKGKLITVVRAVWYTCSQSSGSVLEKERQSIHC